MLSTVAVAEKFNIPERTVRRWFRQFEQKHGNGKQPVVFRRGSRLYVTESSLARVHPELATTNGERRLRNVEKGQSDLFARLDALEDLVNRQFVLLTREMHTASHTKKPV